jgi:hypothetical protein
MLGVIISKLQINWRSLFASTFMVNTAFSNSAMYNAAKVFRVAVSNSLLVMELSPFLFFSWWIYRSHTIARIYIYCQDLLDLYIYVIGYY